MRRNSSGSISGWAEAAPPLTAMNATTVGAQVRESEGLHRDATGAAHVIPFGGGATVPGRGHSGGNLGRRPLCQQEYTHTHRKSTPVRRIDESARQAAHGQSADTRQ